MFDHVPRNGEKAPLIGQPRALDALRLGLAMGAPGYNIFVCGPSGTGKTSTVRALLRDLAAPRRPLQDYLYVHNFDDPDRPRLVVLPAGTARRFRRRVELFVDELPEMVRSVLEAEPIDRRRRDAMRKAEALEAKLLGEFEARCQEERFALTQIQIGDVQHIDLQPIYKRQPIDIDELNEIARSGQGRVPRLAEINARYAQLKDQLHEILRQLRRMAREVKDAIGDIETEAVREAMATSVEGFIEAFPFPGVTEWVDRAIDWITEHLDAFREDDVEDDEHYERAVRALKVNVLLDNEGQTTAPVVFENFPTFSNLLGTVERPSDEPRPTVDFMDIKAGSLLRADGGYLVFNANDAVTEPGVWRTLMRVLKSRELEIQSPEQSLAAGVGSALKPEPIRIDVKVIAVGDTDLYTMLYLGSDEFARVFKVKADFDEVMPRDERGLSIYARHAWRVADEEGLQSPSGEALARLAEHGVRLAGRQDWLSTRFSDLTDVLREASHYAAVAGAEVTGPAHVEQALDARRRRHSLYEDRMRELIGKGVVNLATDGFEVGRVNALTVIDQGDYAFGQPCRISAACSPGHAGVISVEREVELSGRLHDKGTLILEAWLRTRYLPDERVSLSATVVFEQLHAEVEGDSASVAETVALLSALASVPVDQGRAMTGAVDQRGRVLAVGGVNEKIEGFFSVCASRGLNGRQGVVIPADNRDDLVLRDEVVAAVREGRFHIWAVNHVDEVLALVTGREPGEREGVADFPAQSFNAAVQARLRLLSQRAGPPTAPLTT